MSDWTALPLFSLAGRSPTPQARDGTPRPRPAPVFRSPARQSPPPQGRHTWRPRHTLKIRNQRAAIHHGLSHWLMGHYGLIAVEDLNIEGLSCGRLAGAVHGAGLSLPNSGTRLEAPGESWWIRVEASQLCVCGAACSRRLRERWHDVRYGLSARRDVVTAQILLERALIGGSRHHLEDVVSCVPRSLHRLSGDGVISSLSMKRDFLRIIRE